MKLMMISLLVLLAVQGCVDVTESDGPVPIPATGTMTDIDGNVYGTVRIGNQVWMVENLKTTRFNDGQEIPVVSDAFAWGNLSSPGMCWGNNNAANKEPYGGLYNWYAVDTAKLAPVGWHIPTEAEWKALAVYLGGVDIAGGKMKTTTQWFSPNTGATNESGFSAIPVPYRNFDGILFWNIGDGAYFWSTDAFDGAMAVGTHLVCDSRALYISEVSKKYGRSIRCVKN